MLMMKIEMNADKIQAEKRYTLSSITRTIESAFSQMQLRKVEDASGALLYRDTGNARDYGRFGRVVNTLKKQSWFMDNVSVWRLYDSDDSDNLNDCSEEDLLLRRIDDLHVVETFHALGRKRQLVYFIKV